MYYLYVKLIPILLTFILFIEWKFIYDNKVTIVILVYIPKSWSYFRFLYFVNVFCVLSSQIRG